MRIVILSLVMLLALLSGYALPQIGNAADQATHATSMEDCKKNCSSCQKVCEKTLAYCTKKGGKHVQADHLNTLKDCITACKTSAEFLTRGSGLHSKMCGVCAEACKKCAESCEAFDDKQMKDCAAECRKCAESCTKMSS